LQPLLHGLRHALLLLKGLLGYLHPPQLKSPLGARKLPFLFLFGKLLPKPFPLHQA
jgi:hypothetical protein